MGNCNTKKPNKITSIQKSTRPPITKSGQHTFDFLIDNIKFLNTKTVSSKEQRISPCFYRRNTSRRFFKQFFKSK